MGNICRSPMAQGIMEQKIKQYGLNASIDSAGTLAYHTGEPPDERAIETAAYHGINISGQVARQITPADLNLFDLILVMDRENYESVMRLAVPQKAAQRIHYVTYLAFPGKDVEVPDP